MKLFEWNDMVAIFLGHIDNNFQKKLLLQQQKQQQQNVL